MTKTINAQPIPFEKLKDAPGTAFELSAKFSSAESESESELVNVDILARSPEPIYHWWWGKIVHDMEGFFTHKPSIALDWNHDPNVLVGYADKQIADDNGLRLRGKLVKLEDGDQADKIIKWRKAGVPLEGSIYFDEAEMEYIPENTNTKVNGLSFDGPGVIVRKWTIRGCAICPYGYDGKTETMLSRQQFSFSVKELAKVPEQETQTEQTTEVVETEVVEATEVVTPPVDTEKLAKEVREQMKAEMNKFTAAFGEVDGASYFTQNLSFTEAQTKHIAKLTSNIAQLGEENTKLKADLQSFRKALGEESGLDTEPKSTERKFAKSMTEARELSAKK